MGEVRRTRPAVRRVINTAEPSAPAPAPASGRDMPVRRARQGGGERELPTRRDPFPLVMGGVIGALLIGIVLMVVLIGGLIATPANLVTNPAPAAISSPAKDASKTNSITVPAGAPSAAVQGSPLPGTAVPEEGKEHVGEGTPITYKSYPPSSGSHYGSTAQYGFSEKEIPEGKLVHNLEHGAIVLYYKPGLPPETLQSLRDAYTSLPAAKYGKVKLVVTPYSKLKTTLAIAAWGHVEAFSEFDYPRIRTFYEALVDKGPEDVP